MGGEVDVSVVSYLGSVHGRMDLYPSSINYSLAISFLVIHSVFESFASGFSLMALLCIFGEGTVSGAFCLAHRAVFL